MSTLAWNAARILRPLRRRPSRAYCELDSWSFDPRYTDGKCPICGWAAPDAPNAPMWLILARHFEWQLAGLAALMVVLALLAVAVVHAAGFRVAWPAAGAPAAANGVASPARVASPTPSPSMSARPSRTP